MLITFAEAIPVVAGTSYAIVASYPDAGADAGPIGLWKGATGDLYAGGDSFLFEDATWFAFPGNDLFFRTHVTPGEPPLDGGPCAPAPKANVAVTIGGERATSGRGATFWVTVGNAGELPAHNVSATMNVRFARTLRVEGHDDCRIEPADGFDHVICAFGHLAPGEARDLALIAEAISGTAVITVSAVVSSDEDTSPSGDNRWSALVFVPGASTSSARFEDPFTMVLTDACLPEPVALSGIVETRFSSSVHEQAMRFGAHVEMRADGVGETSGSAYRWMQMSSSQQTIAGASGNTSIVVGRLVHPGTGLELTTRLHARFTTTPTGRHVVEIFRFETECR